MIKASFPLKRFEDVRTPFYYYDLDLLDRTLAEVKAQIAEQEGEEET